ncbi:hypothetical protein, partial [Pseudomonas putida]|uniref:hypothetical protein n=1 Tax=Pseudomonas putida TaxID=303 RepID=UPI001F38B01D
DDGLVEGSWTEGYFSTGQMACADLIGESLSACLDSCRVAEVERRPRGASRINPLLQFVSGQSLL